MKLDEEYIISYIAGKCGAKEYKLIKEDPVVHRARIAQLATECLSSSIGLTTEVPQMLLDSVQSRLSAVKVNFSEHRVLKLIHDMNRLWPSRTLELVSGTMTDDQKLLFISPATAVESGQELQMLKAMNKYLSPERMRSENSWLRRFRSYSGCEHKYTWQLWKDGALHADLKRTLALSFIRFIQPLSCPLSSHDLVELTDKRFLEPPPTPNTNTPMMPVNNTLLQSVTNTLMGRSDGLYNKWRAGTLTEKGKVDLINALRSETGSSTDDTNTALRSGTIMEWVQTMDTWFEEKRIPRPAKHRRMRIPSVDEIREYLDTHHNRSLNKWFKQSLPLVQKRELLLEFYIRQDEKDDPVLFDTGYMVEAMDRDLAAAGTINQNPLGVKHLSSHNKSPLTNNQQTTATKHMMTTIPALANKGITTATLIDGVLVDTMTEADTIEAIKQHQATRVAMEELGLDNAYTKQKIAHADKAVEVLGKHLETFLVK
jgi:hypothetical protein